MDFSEQIPEFLTHLDSNRELAVAGFQRFAATLFEQAPPPNYFRVPPDDREDVVSEVILHCIDDDCAKLRKYQPRAGCAFAGWFAVVATRKITDFLRQRRRRDPEVDTDELPDGYGNPGPPDPEQIAIKNELERMFLSALRSIGRRCRLLLRLKVLEFKNREIVEVLRLPKDQNKAIGNQVLECRKKLIRELRETGFFDARGMQGR
jgi:RNA polymerase sigma factor (sigma-70 family)